MQLGKLNEIIHIGAILMSLQLSADFLIIYKYNLWYAIYGSQNL